MKAAAAPSSPHHDLLRVAAAFGLPDAPTLPRRTDSPSSFTDLLATAERQRVVGLLADAVAADADADFDESERDELARTHERWAVHDLRLERQLVRAVDLLDDAGIPYAVFKGPALARRWYARPATRVFADLDLVVPGAHLREAVAVLSAGLGAESALPDLQPGFAERFGKESLLVTAPTAATPQGFEIDLHRTLVAGALGLVIPLDELFTGRDAITVGEQSVRTLGEVPAFLVACYQATVADVPPRLAAARDVVQILRSGALDLDVVLATAARWQARAVVAEAVTWAWATLDRRDADPMLSWARAYRPGPRERALLASHRTTGYVYWRQVAGAAVLPGIEPRVRYLRATLAPQSSYLDGRRWTSTQHVRTAVRALSRPVREPVVREVRRFRRRYWTP